MNLKVSKLNSNCIFGKKKKNEPKEKGSIRAATVSQIAPFASLPAGFLAMKGIQNSSKGLTSEQIKLLNESADKMIEVTGLAAKGVKIENVTSAGLNLSGLPDSVYDLINSYSAIANGKNAAFVEKDLKNRLTGQVLHNKNTIIANRDKLPTALFHEIGHAYNANSSKFWGAMQKMRKPSMALAAGLALFSAFTKKAEAKDGQELTKGQKAKNFVRNNSGILATVSMLPVVAEEVMASVRGCKWAKQNLPKELAKRVKAGNIWGAVSYVSASLALGLAAFLATKIKDSVMEKQKEKFEQQKNLTAVQK